MQEGIPFLLWESVYCQKPFPLLCIVYIMGSICWKLTFCLPIKAVENHWTGPVVLCSFYIEETAYSFEIDISVYEQVNIAWWGLSWCWNVAFCLVLGRNRYLTCFKPQFHCAFSSHVVVVGSGPTLWSKIVHTVKKNSKGSAIEHGLVFFLYAYCHIRQVSSILPSPNYTFK